MPVEQVDKPVENLHCNSVEENSPYNCDNLTNVVVSETPISVY